MGGREGVLRWNPLVCRPRSTCLNQPYSFSCWSCEIFLSPSFAPDAARSEAALKSSSNPILLRLLICPDALQSCADNDMPVLLGLFWRHPI